MTSVLQLMNENRQKVKTIRIPLPVLAIILVSVIAAFVLAACDDSAAQTTLQVDVSGVRQSATLVVENRGGYRYPVEVAGNGTTIVDTLVGGDSYAVANVAEPEGQACEVSNGTGVADLVSHSIVTVAIACVDLAKPEQPINLAFQRHRETP